NRLQSAQRAAGTQMKSHSDALLRHLQISTMRANDLLEAVNKRRTLLGLPEITELTADTKLDTALSGSASLPDFNKQSALRDLTALSGAAKDFPELAKVDADAILADLTKLDSDPALLTILQRRTFIEKGLALIEGPACPLCDKLW